MNEDEKGREDKKRKRKEKTRADKRNKVKMIQYRIPISVI